LDEFVICDEAQNITVSQMKMIITRLGKRSKLIFCGDINQIDLKRKKDSGLGYLIEAGKNIEGFVNIELKTNHRHDIVSEFIESFDRLDSDS
jgi:phosphate starvation-inducible PhoH-like protein